MIKILWNKISLTVKTALVLTAVITGSSTLFINVRDAMAASLKPVSIINADVLTLGDLFDNVKRNADYVIGPAPQPGKDITLNARTLYRIAVALDLPWRPASNGDQITIRREATVIPYSQIEETLKKSLNEKGVSGRFKVSLNNGEPQMVIPSNLPENVEVSSFRHDNQKDYFQATLVAPSAENPVRKMLVSGFIDRIAVVPVLKNTLQNGDVIGRNDIELIEVPQKKVQHNAIMHADDLIGLTPRRIAYGGKFILANALEKPQLVKRGEKVSITFREGPLLLTAKGTALQSGAKGDYIRIKNAKSSRTIDAYITGSNQVVAQ